MRIRKMGDRTWRRIATISGIEISSPGEILIVDEDLLVDGDFIIERNVVVVGSPGTGKTQSWFRYLDGYLAGSMAAKIETSPKWPLRSFSFLRRHLPKELEDHSEEVQQFLEDGMADLDHKNRKLFLFTQYFSLAFYIGKARLFKFSKTWRRTIR